MQYNKNKLNHIAKLIYINCEHRDDRKREFLSQFTDSDKKKIHRLNCSYITQNKEHGCLMSHIRALKYAKKHVNPNDYQSDPLIFIAEDDLEFTDSSKYNRAFNSLLNSKIKWNVLMVGQNTYRPGERINKYLIKTNGSLTTSGYIIKYSYIDTLLDEYIKAQSKYLKDNKWISEEYCSDRAWIGLQSKDNWIVIDPRVAIQRGGFSDIMGGVVNYGL